MTQDFSALVEKVDKITLVSDDADLLRDLLEKANAAHGKRRPLPSRRPIIST